MFLSGDFSSGSTLLFTLFRKTGAYHCLYEPLHERLLEYLVRPLRVYSHHYYVDDYFSEYAGFDEIPALFDPRWGSSGLFLPAGAEAPELNGTRLVLAGPDVRGISDDPEGAETFDQVVKVWHDLPSAARERIDLVSLPTEDGEENAVTVNALQRHARIVVQKSLQEGFGLTVAEAMWKSRPVIGGDTGGIRLQVIDQHTGFLVNSPEGAALRIRYLLSNSHRLEEMGKEAKEFVRENFLLTRHLREYLTAMLAVLNESGDRIELE